MTDVTTTADSNSRLAHPLKSWMVPPKTIGNRTFRGSCVVAEAMHVTYQQQSTTFGRTAGVFGLSKDGDGFVTGGGGFVDTVHKGVVTAVFRDQDGAEQTLELPAGVAAREGAVTRLDMIDSKVISATNISGKGRLIRVLDATSFIDMPTLGRFEIALAIIGTLMVFIGLPKGDMSVTFWGLVAIGVGAFKIWRISKAKRERRELEEYMGEVCA